jgi:hypothetical protein
LIQRYLRRQGFRVQSGRVVPPKNLDKAKLRELHSSAVHHKLEISGKSLARLEPRLIQHIASGTEVAPDKITPRLIEVTPNSEEELLFRYASAHWSIPVSSGYGRRLRFVVIDDHNQKLIGIIGLGDPVFSLSARDNWIGWSASTRKERLYHVMDAFALGAIPPYSFLLCGKLIAMLAASNQVRDAFKRKYGGQVSRIQKRELDARLALVTTTSALGRSSIYNRLRYGDDPLYECVGYTQGFGEFQFSNGLYKPISNYVTRWCTPSDRKQGWGIGFRNRREVVRKCLMKIGLSKTWRVHGIQREVYVVPLARNTKEFLIGKHCRLQWRDLPSEKLFQFFRERWLLPRSERDSRYIQFEKSKYLIWN